jgi:ParB-like chromosome segregation protein Spo0J
MDAAEILIHPFANITRTMPTPAFEAFCKDIEENGLHTPILIYQRRIVDGKHRYRACLKTGVEPRFKEFHGPLWKLLRLIKSNNYSRRHGNEKQNAFAIAKLIQLEERAMASDYEVEIDRCEKKGMDPPRFVDFRAQLIESLTEGVSESDLKEAVEITKKDPAIARAVRDGTVSATAAKNFVDHGSPEDKKRYAKSVKKKDRKGVAESVNAGARSVTYTSAQIKRKRNQLQQDVLQAARNWVKKGKSTRLVKSAAEALVEFENEYGK